MSIGWTAVVATLLGPFNYGLTLVIVNTMLEPMSEDLGFKKNVGGAVASASLYIGIMIGGLTAGPFEKISGRFVQTWIGLLYTTGNLLAGFSTDHKICWGGPLGGCVADMLFFGRLLNGFASGLMLVVSPKYLARVAPPNVRGALGACSQVCIAVGISVGMVIGLPYDIDDSYKIHYAWWRCMFMLAALPSILQIILSPFTFASARRPAPRTDSQQPMLIESSTAADDLSLLCPSGDLSNEKVGGVYLECRQSSPVDWSPVRFLSGIWSEIRENLSLLLEARYRHSIILGIGVPVATQLIGSSIMDVYSTTILRDVGLEDAVIGSIVYAFGDVLASGISVMLFDRYGRIAMACISFSGMAFSYLALALSQLASSVVSGYLSVVFIITFVLSFGSGCGTLNVSYAPEVVPAQIASMVLGMGQSLSILVAFSEVLLFPTVFDTIGAFSSFLILFTICIVSLFFLKNFMVETKGRQLDEIVQSMCASHR